MGKETLKTVASTSTRATVLDAGMVKIPANVRKAAGIEAGSHVTFTPLPDGRVVMRVKSGTLADLKGIVKTSRRATDAQIRSGKPATVFRDAGSGAFKVAKGHAIKAAGKTPTKLAAKKK